MKPALLALLVLPLAACTAAPPSMSNAVWEPLETGSEASLRGLHAVDAQVVWATGSGGTVLRSVDGGASWAPLSVTGGEGEELRDVHAFDAGTAFVLAVTEPARIVRTTDGGETWDEVHRSPDAAFLDSIHFETREVGYAYGDPLDGGFLVLRTRDGGASWTRVPIADLPPAAEGEAGFAASGTCIASCGDGVWIGTGGTRARVLRSLDGGDSWSAAETPMQSGETSTGVFSVAFADASRGVIVGGDYANPELAEGHVARTEDGGTSWTAVEGAAATGGYRSAVAWVPGRDDALVAVGRGGSDWSEDGGRTWHTLGDNGYYALSFAPTGEGFAVGAEGRAARLVFAADE